MELDLEKTFAIVLEGSQSGILGKLPNGQQENNSEE